MYLFCSHLQRDLFLLRSSHKSVSEPQSAQGLEGAGQSQPGAFRTPLGKLQESACGAQKQAFAPLKRRAGLEPSVSACVDPITEGSNSEGNNPMRSFTRLVFLSALALGMTAPAFAAETAGDYVDDAAISTKIKASLIKDQELKAFDIHVDTDHGIVHLSGNVDNMVQKSDAVRIAKGTANVKDVVNDIMVAKK
jgi:hypothetical protein